MRGDNDLLFDMLNAARKIQRFVAGMTLAEFQAYEMAQSAVIRELHNRRGSAHDYGRDTRRVRWD